MLKPLRKGRQPAITDLVPLRRMINAAEEDYARPITRLALRLLALTAVRPSELRGRAVGTKFEDLKRQSCRYGVSRFWRMKGDLDRKEELNGDHLVPTDASGTCRPQSALAVDRRRRTAVFRATGTRHRPMSENAIGYLLNRAGYHGHHVPHGFRAAFSTIMNEWAEREGKDHDRQVIDLMLAHVPTGKVEGVYKPCGLHAAPARAGDSPGPVC